MCDQDHFEHDEQEYLTRGLVTRRQFGVLLGAGVSLLLPKVANAAAVTESDVSVTTPDGAADCYFVHPASGAAAGVLVWPDIFGLRPAFRQMGKRLAESGYSVLVVNPFYRTKKAPTADAGSATVLAEEFYVFANGAVTGVLLLAQSHLSIHTWPELLMANVDLLSYGDVDGDAVMNTVSEALHAERTSVSCVLRGLR